ncbi:MAG: DNA alkylation repair protein, partial [Hyphomicrobiales bacterium]
MTNGQLVTASAAVAELRAVFEGARDPARAGAMAAYMRDQFPFLGIPSPARRALQRAFVASFRKAEPAVVLAAAKALWELPEREYQYAACDLLGRHARRLGAEAIFELEKLVLAKAWWDTVDALAAHIVGP